MKYLWLFLIPSVSYGFNCRNVDVIQQIRPGSQWKMTNDDPHTLQFFDSTKTPTDVEISSGMTVCSAALNTRQQLVNKALFDVKASTIPINTKFQELLMILNLDK